MALLGWRFWAYLSLLMGLAVSHAFTYRAGRAVVRAQWDRERAEQIAQALAASEAARAKEKQLIAANEKVRADYAKQKSLNAALVRANDDRLREFQAAADRAAGGDAASTARAYGPFASIAGECVRAIGALDEHAQGLRATASALQEFTKQMYLKKD